MAVNSNTTAKGKFTIIDANGNTLLTFTKQINKGHNIISYNNMENLADGNYYLHLNLSGKYFIEKIVKKR